MTAEQSPSAKDPDVELLVLLPATPFYEEGTFTSPQREAFLRNWFRRVQRERIFFQDENDTGFRYWFNDADISLWMREMMYQVMQEHADVTATRVHKYSRICHVAIHGIRSSNHRRMKDFIAFTGMTQVMPEEPTEADIDVPFQPATPSSRLKRFLLSLLPQAKPPSPPDDETTR